MTKGRAIPRRAIALVFAAAVVAAPARGQSREPALSPAEVRALDARMRTLADSMREYGDSESFAAFFPRRGSWSWTRYLRGAPGGDRAQSRRFRAEETVEALSDSGPLCPSFFRGGGEVETSSTSIAGWLSDTGRGWRRFGRRFVPRGSPASSPTFVEWMREDGRWVIAAFGDEDTWSPPPPRPDYPAVRRSPTVGPPLKLPLPADGRYAASAPWFVSDGPISINGRLRLKYGLPRRLGDGDVTRIGWIEGVPVYVEPSDADAATVIYVAVDAEGTFQPYYPGSNYSCR
ncbi:MAG: hypothetical protein ACJ8GN_31075 [Longimicrobiaceae bacterium]